ncbi:putative phage abortive infection protein [Aeromonas hydrophila]|uniref:putative phage abortive infection protein n=1 Tax=Aeromonas hydrophila TaxID=644 RepID=UPI00321750ED
MEKIKKRDICHSFKLRTEWLLRKGYLRFKSILVGKERIKPSDRKLLYTLYLLLIFGLASFLSLFTLNYIANKLLEKGESWGQFGDFLGGVLNPIFTLMTFFGVIITIALQKLELRAAREEYKKSANALDTQAIENTFFNMLNLHYKITENLKFDAEAFMEVYSLHLPYSKNNSRNGTAAFSLLFDIFLSNAAYNMEKTFEIYRHLQNNYNYIFGHYFRNLYQIIRFVAKNDNIKTEHKKKYMNMLRAHLSSDELFFLFINCTESMVDNGEFRELLIEYSFLEHMPLEYNKTNKCYLNQGVIVANLISIKDFQSKDPSKLSAFGKKNIYLP